MSDTHKGGCFCGAIAFEVTGAPVAEGFCHCNDCRTWSAAPFVAFTLWPPEAVKITKGEASLATFAKSERSKRKYCSACGGHRSSLMPKGRLT